MRILHVVPTYLPARRYGGPIYSVHGLCKALQAQGHDIHVFTTSVDGDADSVVPLAEPVPVDGVNVWYFRCPWLRRLYYAPSMGRALKEQVANFDLVHLHSVYLWPTWAAARSACRAGVPYFLSPRGMLDASLVRRKSRWLKTAWIKLIERRNLRNAAAVHVTSRYEKEALLALGFEPRDLVTIPNGVDQPAEPQNGSFIGDDVRRIVEGGDYVLFFGRVHWKKGLDRLIEAWPGRKDCRLVIAGNDEEGYAGRLRARIREKGIDGIELVVRDISGAEKEALYRNARLFVLPSYSENFGNTVLEAMMHRIAVLVTPEVGAAQIVVEAGGGRVVEGSELSSAMDAMLNDSDGLEAMGRRGYAFASRHCSWEAVATDMLQAYTRHIDGAGERVLSEA